MPSEYSVDFNRGFQGFSMANLEKGMVKLDQFVHGLRSKGQILLNFNHKDFLYQIIPE